MKIFKITMLAVSLGLMSFAVIKPINTIVEKEKSAVIVASVLWKAETIDVGEIPQGTPKKMVYEFTNTSKAVIIITNVQGSCGCTATDYTKTPIAAGAKGTVTATYNAASAGSFSKTVTVNLNDGLAPSVLTLKGVVKAVEAKI
ncbi:putative membrane protein [Flavobacterium sp. 7E]|uniref:DUF1573 domain-containing protein n=1 Tax=unclassified Flavobacterium TaxID=196869 RepID=UPI0015713C14|nr:MULTISPECIES: DUF1573 domain-containing protein [unclassified Flavobacterium]NRS89222.1 putative membrane protein [Flavobacterium sp. 7E]NRT16516.1 putative membrane protein [Flavobacterium sp. 28A]